MTTSLFADAREMKARRSHALAPYRYGVDGHTIAVWPDEDGRRLWQGCSCGWVGRPISIVEAAVEMAVAHLSRVLAKRILTGEVVAADPAAP